MYLKRMYIQGFKSFRDRLRLDFTRGITAVVGPNGSGKSNISDAARWAIGEQSAKTLRGGKMEDVIFAGAESSRAVGMAEVSLLIDNSDRKLPLDFDEIKVTRRIYRSGESEYQMNGADCRLKDITSLFMDTGVGREGYSIIGQGRIDEILSAKGEDRRLLFEEAAGIVKFRARKEEAEAKLARERQNLLRLADVMEEMENALPALSEQAETAKKYAALSERLKLVRVSLFLKEIAGAGEKISALEEAAEAAGLELSLANEKKARAKEAAEDFKRRNEARAAEYKALLTQIADSRAVLSEYEKKAGLSREKISHSDRDEQKLTAEGEKNAGLQTVKNAEISGFSRHLEALGQREAALRAEAGELSAGFEEEAAREPDETAALSAAVFDKMDEISALRLLAQKEAAASDALKLTREDLNAAITALDKELAETAGLSERLGLAAGALKEREAAARAAAAERAGRLSALRDSHAEVLKKRNAAKVRLKLLKELEDAHQGYAKSVRAVLSQNFRGLRGALGELIKVSPGFETAVETALGGGIQHIVADTEEDCAAAITYLKENKRGRATFLPMTAVKAKNLPPGVLERLRGLPGFLGAAKDFAVYSPEYEGVAANALGAVIVADSFENAVELSRATGRAYKIVTREGELLSAGGAITGGASSISANIFGRGREIEELRQAAELLGADLAFLDGETDSLSAEAEEAEELSRRLALDSAEKTREAARAAEKLLELSARREEAARKYAENNIKLEETETLRAGSGRRTEEAESALEALKSELAAQKALAEGERERREARAARLSNLRVELAGITEKKTAAEDNLERTKEELAALAEERGRLLRELATAARARTEALAEERLAAARIEEISGEIAEKESALAELEAASREYSEKTAEYEEELEALREAASGAERERARYIMKKEQAEEDVRRLYALMWDEYEITAGSARGYPVIEGDAAALAAEEKSLRAAVRELGPVNPSAVEEYRARRERRDFLAAQRDDLLAAESDLKKLITELETLMEQRFREQFALISENFNAVFSEMFGGGSASLELSNERDPLNSSVEMAARPPGKKTRVMSLLSGGERALTALSLLFAILRLKPSPFCLLDEIEAALDDANVARFANFLRNSAEGTQFIIITHKKGTMTAADALYGVTQRERGVSSVVSLSLKEAEKEV
ncbi:MAG: chromosome segregation protein SMC [Clostridiales bacterium]|jgi:chromosome segregation protein|nr:chromosome segregation protein SMC [Clostridiales bacterium]